MRHAYILLGVLMAACAGGTAQAQGKQDFTLINATELIAKPSWLGDFSS